MTDKKNDGPDLEGLDWDSALAEWEEKTFLPEPAKDRETNQPATLTGTPPPPPAHAPSTSPASAKPLYRPPTAAPAHHHAHHEPPIEGEDEDEEANATVIAAIPRELLRGAGKVEEPRGGGGLGQMFARGPTVPPREEAAAPSHRPPEIDEDPSVITSAKQVATALRAKNEPIRPPLPSTIEVNEQVPEGAMFDPFAEPAAAGHRPEPSGAPPQVVSELTPMPAVDEGTSVRTPPPPGGMDALLRAMGDDARETRPDRSSHPPAAPPPGPSLHVPRARAFDPNDDTSSHVKNAIHSPSRREYDPNEETSVLSKAALPFDGTSAPEVSVAEEDFDELEETEDQPTRFARRGSSARPPKLTQSWDDEAPARERLNDALRAGLLARAEWLEAEARAVDDRPRRARALLAVSELRAILGDAEQAEILAREACALAPQLALAPRQARALTAPPRDVLAVVEALDAEVRQSPTPAARVHGALLAADVLRTSGDPAGAMKRWEQALKVAPTDARAALARAAFVLARGEVNSPALRLPDAPELAPLAAAIATALRLRGIERGEVADDALLPNDRLRRAREALAQDDVAAAAARVAELARVPELAEPAAWLAASLGATRATTRATTVAWLRSIDGATARDAKRAIAARGVELGDPQIVAQALEDDDAFSAADRALLGALALAPNPPSDADLDALAASDDLRPLAAAIAGASARADRADRVAGREPARRTVKLARLLAANAPAAQIEDALAAMAGEHDGESRAVALEMAARAGRFDEVSDALAAWAGSDDETETAARDRQLAAALVAERSGDTARAVAAYTAARAMDATNEAALRAIAALDRSADVPAALAALAHATDDGARAALARIEAVARGATSIDEAARAELLDEAHRAAPSLPIAAFEAEHLARRGGDVGGALRWIRERRAASHDAIENALDGVREALFVAESDPELASTRLEEAHRARPSDVAMREMYERMSAEPLTDRGAWRERRAAAITGEARAVLLTEAAHEFERVGDVAGTLRTARAAREAGDEGLGRLALERAEVEGGEAARLADELLVVARQSDDPRERREAYERLADLDATGRDDPASALLWHRTVLEESPAHLASLRHVEHALLGDARVDEIEPVAAAIARALAPAADGEATAHAAMAMRLRMRGPAGEWEPTRSMADLAASFPQPALWALRAANAHARGAGDDEAIARTAIELSERTSRSLEVAALSLRAAEAEARLDDDDRARELFERAAREDPGDVVTWGQLADVRGRASDPRGAAEACEALARTSVVDEHQLLAWFDAGRIWLDEVGDVDRGVAALEQAASLDVTFQDVFARLSALYAQRGARAEIAQLLERRLARVTDHEERVTLEIERARALADVGDVGTARDALEEALAASPDHTGALSAYADLCAAQKDWTGAEQAWVRLARLLSSPDDQRAIYAKLGELYATHAPNLSRAEVALREVLKRAPDDAPTLERLVDVYRRQNDPARAIETQQQLLKLSTTPDQRRERLVQLAAIHEAARDPRKAEQALEAARRESPHDVGALRALAEFYQRQRQLPAVNILLDRASGDARRALAAGRFAPAYFEVMQAAFDLRGKHEAARVVAATLAALEGRPAQLAGAEGRAADPRLDDLLAPEPLNAGLRALLLRTGDALDAASAVDLRALRATPIPSGAAQARIAALASSMGLAPVQALVSPSLGRTCVPGASSPPMIVLGEPLVGVIHEPAATFLVTRALKLVQAHASSLVRTPPQDLVVLVAAWLQAFNPSWQPQGIDAGALADASRRVHAGLPRDLDPDLGMIALEISGTLGAQAASLGAHAIAWADRVALLALGDPNAALDAIAWSLGAHEGAPRDPEARAPWVARTPEAKDLLVFSVSDAYAELRARLHLDR